jgi:hypothetical protein
VRRRGWGVGAEGGNDFGDGTASERLDGDDGRIASLPLVLDLLRGRVPPCPPSEGVAAWSDRSRGLQDRRARLDGGMERGSRVAWIGRSEASDGVGRSRSGKALGTRTRGRERGLEGSSEGGEEGFGFCGRAKSR